MELTFEHVHMSFNYQPYLLLLPYSLPNTSTIVPLWSGAAAPFTCYNTVWL